MPTGFEDDIMYLNLFFARKFSVLRRTHLPSLINSEIKILVQEKRFFEALQLYTRDSPLSIANSTFPCLLKACAFLSNISYGKTIHATMVILGLQFDPHITTSLINAYVKCWSLRDAAQLFTAMSECEASARDVTVWNSMIDGYLKHGYIEEGMGLFYGMKLLNVQPDAYSLSILLGLCDNQSRFLEGRQVHGYIVRNKLDDDFFVVTALIGMYSHCGRPLESWHVFRKLEEKNNVVVWNAMIRAFCENGLWESSLELYSLAKNENCLPVSTSLSCALAACCRGHDVDLGKQLHSDVIKLCLVSDPYVCTSLLTMYGKYGLVDDAEGVFVSASDKQTELWNAMISAYLGNGCAYDALAVYTQMRLSSAPSDFFTISNLLAACTMLGFYNFGRTLHGELIKRPSLGNVAVQSALLTMYSKSGNTRDAYAIFIAIKEKDVVAWGSMISGFCQNMKFKEAFELFKLMDAERLKPDSDIMANVIGCCEGLENIQLGCGIHGFVIKSGLASDVFVGSSLIDMYSKCGLPKMAELVFTGMLHNNLVVWNSMISCYCQNGFPELAISLLPQILQQGLYLDSISVTSILVAISSVAALLKGKTVHGYQIRTEIPSDLQVQNALIGMYMKCGCLKYARHVFQNMTDKTVVTWNMMIAGYGSHGECLQAIDLFDEMRKSGIRADDVTFLSLISSCNHSGLVKEGLNFFEMMRVEFNIEPVMEHYVNIVDLLGRAGRLDDAFNFIRKMPIEPDRSIWLCLLSACRAHHNTKLGELAAHKLLKMDPKRGSNYAQILNLYVEAGLGDTAAELRAWMRQKGLKKNPGCSWIELGNKVDTFFSGDSSSPRTVEIYQILGSLKSNMERKRGYPEDLEAFETGIQ